MECFRNTNAIVLEILEGNKDSRSSDDYLYSLVCKQIAEFNGRNYETLSHKEALLQRKALGFPSYVTVCRARRRLQIKYPILAAAEDVEVYRELNEKAYREEYRAD